MLRWRWDFANEDAICVGWHVPVTDVSLSKVGFVNDGFRLRSGFAAVEFGCGDAAVMRT